MGINDVIIPRKKLFFWKNNIICLTDNVNVWSKYKPRKAVSNTNTCAKSQEN